MNKRFLCIWIPNWPCQRLLAMDSSLHQMPLILQTRDSRRGLLVAASNMLARQLGINPGMSISEATSLQSRLTSKETTNKRPSTSEGRSRREQQAPSRFASMLQIREHDPQEDLESLVSLAESAQEFSPIVSLEAIDTERWSCRSILQPQGLMLDVTGIGPLFRGEEKLAEEVQTWMMRQGYLACVAIANSPGGAWALANFHDRHKLALYPFDSGLQSDTSTACPTDAQQSEHGKEPSRLLPPTWPRPIAIDTDEELANHLNNLPIDALRLDALTIASLKRLGIEGVGTLASFPRDGLVSRLGTKLLERFDQAFGLRCEAIGTVHADPDFSAELNLEFPTDNRATIEEILRRLVVQVSNRLESKGQGALRILCRFDIVEQPSRILQLGLYRSSADASYLTNLLLGQLEQRWQTTALVHHVLLQCTLTGPLTWRQPDLFQSDEVTHRDGAAQLIDSLSNRLGRRAVVAPKIQRDPQPELASQWRPLTGLRNDGSTQSTKRKLPRGAPQSAAEPSIADPLRRPLFLIQPPVRLEVIAIFPEGIPCQFRIDKSKRTVVRHWGPERIESGWWRGPSQRRDYYRVETDDGQWLWLFRELNDGGWFLHGHFD